MLKKFTKREDFFTNVGPRRSSIYFKIGFLKTFLKHLSREKIDAIIELS